MSPKSDRKTPRVYDDGESTPRPDKPKLLWPRTPGNETPSCGALNGWMSRAELMNETASHGLPPSSSDPRLEVAQYEFREALSKAERHIYVLDVYAYDGALPVLHEAMRTTKATDIRILSGKINKDDKRINLFCSINNDGNIKSTHFTLDDAVKQLRADRAEGDSSQRHRATVEWRFLLDANLVHDRFSLIDDELWHWGTSVGGVHAGIHASSRGWFRSSSDFRELFCEIWNYKSRGR